MAAVADRSCTPVAALAEELRLLDLRLLRRVLERRVAEGGSSPAAGGFLDDAMRLAGLDPGAREREDAVARLARVRGRLAEIGTGGRASALERLARTFRLTDAELDVVVVGAAAQLDGSYVRLFRELGDGPSAGDPTAGLVLELVFDGLEARIDGRALLAAVEAPLRAHALVGLLDPGAPLLARGVRTAEPVVDMLAGTFPAVTAERSGALGELGLDAALRQRLERAAAWLAGGGRCLVLRGPRGAGKRSIAAAVASELGLPLLARDVAAPVAADDLAVGTALRRDAALTGAALYVTGVDAARPEAAAWALAHELAIAPQPVIIGACAGWPTVADWPSAALVAIDVGVPPLRVRQALWRARLREAGEPKARAGDLANAFALTPGGIARAAEHARHLAAAGETDGATVHAAARAVSSSGMHGLAARLEAGAGWQDLVLAPRALRALRELCATVRHRPLVQGRWGFDGPGLGRPGLTALFAGPSGTGKTMAAAVVAADLGLDAFRIDLARVVSKYIGETEKQLEALFAAAEASNAILLFDEAEALFGKRTRTRDAHDRYANIEIAYLLQRVERHPGVVLLTTNRKEDLDEAFARRIDCLVEFPMPDAAARERLWRRSLPASAPLGDDADLELLARGFELAGGGIRNAALTAAFLAAEAGGPIGMRHLVAGVARELAKVGQVPTQGELGRWYELLREER
jgi:hypothetical protein